MGRVTDGELRKALDGLFAYDGGATDSGIHDEGLRARCITALKEHRAAAEQWRPFVARLVRDMWLSDEAIGQGYGLEDALEFTEWLEERMDCQVRI